MIQKMSFDFSFDDAAMPRFGSDSILILFALNDAFGTGDDMEFPDTFEWAAASSGPRTPVTFPSFLGFFHSQKEFILCGSGAIKITELEPHEMFREHNYETSNQTQKKNLKTLVSKFAV